MDHLYKNPTRSFLYMWIIRSFHRFTESEPSGIHVFIKFHRWSLGTPTCGNPPPDFSSLSFRGTTLFFSLKGFQLTLTEKFNLGLWSGINLIFRSRETEREKLNSHKKNQHSALNTTPNSPSWASNSNLHVLVWTWHFVSHRAACIASSFIHIGILFSLSLQMTLLKYSKIKEFTQHQTDSTWQSHHVCVTLVF